MKKLLILAAAVLCLSACGGEAVSASTGPQALTDSQTEPAPDTGQENSTSGYVFEYNGVSISMGAPAADIIAALGEPISEFEAESCAGQGVDITYSYPGFELVTYPGADGENVLSVSLLDDTVETDKGIMIGSSGSEIEAAYGKNGADGDLLEYSQEDMKLTFTLENDETVYIEYRYLVG
ncbi:MAG: hypothetical protein Q4B42_02025 [Oscillospiraceae bacterium]|nr:hypothetical protein [Oscillospiraceae bacterium]